MEQRREEMRSPTENYLYALDHRWNIQPSAEALTFVGFSCYLVDVEAFPSLARRGKWGNRKEEDEEEERVGGRWGCWKMKCPSVLNERSFLSSGIRRRAFRRQPVALCRRLNMKRRERLPSSYPRNVARRLMICSKKSSGV